MKLDDFRQALADFSLEDWQAVQEGAGIVVEMDARLVIGDPDQAFALYELGDEAHADASALKASLLERAEALWQEYYQYNPFSKQGFYRQAQALVDEHGAEAFIAMPSKPATHRMFVDGAELKAVTEKDLVFKYAFYLTVDQDLKPLPLENKVKNWLSSGGAYEDYISVNVCRFGAQN